MVSPRIRLYAALATLTLLSVAPLSGTARTRLTPRDERPTRAAAAAPVSVPQNRASSISTTVDRARQALHDAEQAISNNATDENKAAYSSAVEDFVVAVNERQLLIQQQLSELGADLKDRRLVPGDDDPVASEYLKLDAEYWDLDREVTTYRPSPEAVRPTAHVMGPVDPEAVAAPFSQNFDGVVAPALPANWSSTVAQGVILPWATTTTAPVDTAPNTAFVTPVTTVADSRLNAPNFFTTAATPQVTFRRSHNLEQASATTGFDGMVLEISINGGAFVDILAAGGSFVAGGYTHTISVNFSNPLAGRMAWSGSTAGAYVTTTVNLPTGEGGRTIALRWRVGTDSSFVPTGTTARIDTITSTGLDTLPVAACFEGFDGVTPPALPAGWTAMVAQGTVPAWVTSTSAPVDTPPNNAFANMNANLSDSRLDSAQVPITSATAQVQFRRQNTLETNFDGMVLEISIAGGAFQDILAAGGSFVTGGYNGTISVNFMSPIAGRMAWTGTTAGYVTTLVNLPAAANGQLVNLRWRAATDSSIIVTGSGARIDSVLFLRANCSGQCMITCPANITVSNTPGTCGAVVNYPAPTATASCGTVTCVPASGSTFPVGTTTVTCTSQAGPTCMFTVRVNDTQPPTITCPANITVSNTPNQCGAVVNYPAPTVSDNCPGVGAAVCSPATGSFFPVGLTTVTCTVADAAMNTATCSFTVRVNDTQPPVITCPAPIAASANIIQNNVPGAIVNFAPTVSDNCPGVTFACAPASGSFFPQGVTTVTCTATDASMNTANCSFTVTVTVPFTHCYVDDATGNRLSIVAVAGDPLFRLWQLRLANGMIIQGFAEYIALTPGHSLIAYDNDGPTVWMNLNVNMGSRTATATVVNYATGIRYVIRDRDITNNGMCAN